MFNLRTYWIIVPAIIAAFSGKSSGQLRRLPTVKQAVVRLVNYEQPLAKPSLIRSSEPSRISVKPAVHADEEGLTLSDLKQIAEQNHPALTAAVALVEAKEGLWLQVGLLPNPVIGYAGEEMGGGSAGQQGGFIQQQIVTGGKLNLNRAVVYEEVQRARQELEVQRLRLQTDIKINYYKTLAAQRRYDLARNLVKISERAIQASEALFQAEQSSRIEVLQARTEAGSARIMLQNTRNQHWQAWRELAAVLARPNMQLQKLSGNLEASAPQLNWQTVINQIVTNSPQLAAAHIKVNRARWAVQRACAEVIPDIDMQFSLQHDNNDGQTITSVKAGVPLPLFNRNQGAIFQAKSELVARQRQVERLELQLQNQLADVFRRYASAQYEIENYATKILPNTQKTLDLVTTGYEEGEFGFLTLLTAQRTFFQTHLAYVDSLEKVWASVSEIEGFLLTGSLQGDL